MSIYPDTNLRPGHAYIMADNARPGLLKLGKANSPRSRYRFLRTGNPGLELVATQAFLDAPSADRQILRHFVSQRVTGEWHQVTQEEVLAVWKALAEEQALVHGHRREVKAFGRNAGLLPMPRKVRGQSPALAWLLSQPCPTKPGVTVGQAVMQALLPSRGQAGFNRALKLCGLEVQSVDKVVVFDKRKGAALENLFSRGEARSTWRQQLLELAGLDGNLKSIKLTDWLRYTMSQPSIQQMAR